MYLAVKVRGLFYHKLLVMQRLLFCVLLAFVALAVKAQVTTNPTIAMVDQSVTITFDATQGTAGLKDYTGDVYAHTGVITDKSTSTSDWKYVKAGWTVNTAACKLTRVSANIYTLTVGSSIRAFYGVPSSEKILKMAFVFRSSDGSKEGKATGNKDIFVDVYESGVVVSFAQPSAVYSVLQPSSVLSIQVNASNNQSIDLYQNDILVTSVQGNTLIHNLTIPTSGKYMLRAVATGTGGTAADTAWFLVKTAVQVESMPSGLKRGVTRINDQSVYLKFFAPQKQFVYVAGDFNDWMPDAVHQMKKDGDYFWLRLDGLSPNTEYGYQYWIDNSIKIPDPYTNKILDPNNDKYIPDAIYPNLKKYPVGKTDEFVSVFQTNPVAYNWQVANFTPPSPDTLVVYELLIRDFTANRDIKTVTDTLAYLKRLGVNAIELMPFNEFEGNDSWGYNPALYFAPDKAYGTANDYKRFIDECHRLGIAVIQDMVLNHSFGQSPFVRMYFENGKPAANNPWYNVNHNMQNPDAQWGYDFNHQSLETQALVDSVCAFWMQEFKVDGFRFDFTKGFTNTVYGPTDWASAYDAQRINILKRMANEIWKRKPNALVIFEHLSDNSEEKVLAEHGILLWGNHNHNFNEGTMGYNESGKSDLSWANYKNRGWGKPHVINYMESHDEERLMVKNLLYGNSYLTYNIKTLSTALSRMQMAGALLFSIPGPKMIWQFGELGYDVSIDFNGRTGVKPIRWEYQSNPDRLAVYNMWANFIKLKKAEPVFSTTDFETDLYGPVKIVKLKKTGENVIFIGNFDVKSQAVNLAMPESGKWYDYFNGDSIELMTTSYSFTLLPGTFRLISQKRLVGFETNVNPPTVERSKSTFATPNPCVEELTIVNPFEKKAKVEFYNLHGRKVHHLSELDVKADLKVNAWGQGLYLLKLTDEDGNVAFQKLIKK